MEEAALSLLKDMLKRTRRLMRDEYGLTRVHIRPMGGGGSRLSIPCELTGTRDGERVRYFGKIIGSSDYVSALSAQLLKNLYLRMNAKDPIFGAPVSAEGMARYQFDTLKLMREAGIPAARPYGCHAIDDMRWLLVVEFVEGTPLSKAEIGQEEMDRTFMRLRSLHDKRLYHGDIKPDNIMFGKEVYILDVGRFSEGVPVRTKVAYDLACTICSFLHQMSPQDIIKSARRHYSAKYVAQAADYIRLVQARPDIYFTDETASALMRLMKK